MLLIDFCAQGSLVDCARWGTSGQKHWWIWWVRLIVSAIQQLGSIGRVASFVSPWILQHGELDWKHAFTQLNAGFTTSITKCSSSKLIMSTEYSGWTGGGTGAFLQLQCYAKLSTSNCGSSCSGLRTTRTAAVFFSPFLAATINHNMVMVASSQFGFIRMWPFTPIHQLLLLKAERRQTPEEHQ